MQTAGHGSARYAALRRCLLGLVGLGLPFAAWACEQSGEATTGPFINILVPAPAPRTDHWQGYGGSVAPSLRWSITPTNGSVVVVNELDAGRGDVGLAQADVVYSAYRHGIGSNESPHDNIRAIAVLGVNRFYVFVHRDSDVVRFDQLKGRRIAVPGKGSAGEIFTRTVLEAHGLSYADLDVDFQPSSEQPERFLSGQFDATIVVNSGSARAISNPIPPGDLRLLPIDDDVVARLRAEFPFITPVVIPAQALPSVTHEIRTIGVDSLLVCRADLDEEVVYRLTKAFFEHPRLSRVYAVDPDQAPATPIPTHPGAARYYREREILN